MKLWRKRDFRALREGKGDLNTIGPSFSVSPMLFSQDDVVSDGYDMAGATEEG